MTFEMYRLIFIVSAVLSGAMLLLSVLLFFIFRVPELVGYLSGKTAKKAIESIRNQNLNTGDTDRIYENGRVESIAMTDKISTSKLTNETEVLTSSNETTILNAEYETEILSPSQSQESVKVDTPISIAVGVGITIVEEVTFIHTEEVIE